MEAAEEMQREQERRTRQAGISYIKYIEAVRERQYGIMPVYTPLFEKEQYCEMVEKAKHHIKEGDIFQIVLSNRLSAPFEGSLFDTYRVLRTINPSPYMFIFREPMWRSLEHLRRHL